MRAHYEKLFRYDAWANQRVIDAVATLPAPNAKILGWLAHIFWSQNLWYGRIQHQDWSQTALQLDQPVAAWRQVATDYAERWQAFLATVAPDEWHGWISYRSTEGVAYRSLLSDILTHVVNHGSYHRGQIAAAIRQSGGVPVPTDFIVLSRETSP